MPAKHLFPLWDPRNRSPDALKRLLVDDLGSALIELAPDQLTVLVQDDQAAQVKCPAPPKLGESRPIGQVAIWGDDPGLVECTLEEIRKRSLSTHGYAVDESIYTDYGGNRHGAPRDWPDGTRSPGVMLLTLMQRPRRLTHDEWMKRWHGRQSPVSEAMQPRARYVRNVVQRAVTEKALPIEGIVEEAWPSKEHVENPYLFYGASTRWALVKNQITMLRSVTAFLNILTLRTAMVGEYFLKSRA